MDFISFLLQIGVALSIHAPTFLQDKEKLRSFLSGGKEIVTVTSRLSVTAFTTYYMYRLIKAENTGNKDENNNKSYYSIHAAGTIKESFKSIAGNDTAKSELNDIIEYFKNKKAFDEIGAKLPKGILLCGPSGTGKTLLARALAGEANCSFIAVAGSEFDEKYVGVGAARVRQLFETARSINGPCIIFIDEIDALLPNRNAFGTEGSGYTQTINEFLTQLDGFVPHKYPIMIIGATNRAQSMDTAALRPGRFDRIINVGLPTVDDREKILAVYAQKIKHNKSINLRSIAERTEGFSGAHLANIINEAAFIALKNKRTRVTQKDLEAACDKIIQSEALYKREHVYC